MLPEIPFLDLRRLQAPRAQALQDALAAVVARGIYILGPELEAFEAEVAAYWSGTTTSPYEDDAVMPDMAAMVMAPAPAGHAWI